MDSTKGDSRVAGSEVDLAAEGADEKPDVTSDETSGVYPFAESDLSPTAVKLLEAGRRILERSGYGALTLEAIAKEAGGNKALFRYHFGDKAGFLVALVDWVLHDYLGDVRRLAESADDEEGTDRVATLTQSVPGRLLDDLHSYLLFFDLLPNVLDEPAMRPHLAGLYREYRRFNARALSARAAAASEDLLEEIAALNIAVADGLAIQLLAEPGSINVARALEHWSAFCRQLLENESSGGRR
jgi:AcrR family transcriptional regulator